MDESSFQISVFRVQLRREEEKTSADYADYLRRGEFVEENEDSYGRDAHTTVFKTFTTV